MKAGTWLTFVVLLALFAALFFADARPFALAALTSFGVVVLVFALVPRFTSVVAVRAKMILLWVASFVIAPAVVYALFGPLPVIASFGPSAVIAYLVIRSAIESRRARVYAARLREDLEAGQSIGDLVERLASWHYIGITWSLLALLDHDRYDAILRVLEDPWWRAEQFDRRSIFASYRILALLGTARIDEARHEWDHAIEPTQAQLLGDYRDSGREVSADERANAGDLEGAKQSLRELSPNGASRRLERIKRSSRPTAAIAASLLAETDSPFR